MSLKIYNSLNNKIEDFTIKDNTVTMYVCGPTVYNYIHLGNARPVIFFDMVKRYLKFLNVDVKYATNITDVDDKIIKKAKELNVDESILSEKFAKAFLQNCKDLNCLAFDEIPRATSYINQMISFIEKMIELDLAYVVDGDVYFRVNKAIEYGKLSNQKLDELTSGVRIQESNKKENQADFTLWKKTNEGIKWNASFSKGRPGWHTECATMIYNIFHQTIDLHGGGFDLKFPHHENEIAQFESVYKQPLSRYFMHVGRLDFSGEKMSKSLGNTILVNDLKDKDLIMQFRLLILMNNYRNNLNFTFELLEEFNKEYLKIQRVFKQASLLLDLNRYSKNEVDDELIQEFKEYMDDDFNTPNVLTLLQKITKQLNASIRSETLEVTSILLKTLIKILNVLGFRFNYTKLNDTQREIYNQWSFAKSQKDFETADNLRIKLVSEGIL